MESNVLLDEKNKLIIQIKNGDHTLCNALRKELMSDSHVKNAGYTIRHPLVGIPRLLIETDTSTTPRKALQTACQRLKKQNEHLRKAIQSEIK